MSDTIERNRKWLIDHLGRLVWDQRMHNSLVSLGVPIHPIDTYDRLARLNGLPKEIGVVLDELAALGMLNLPAPSTPAPRRDE